MTKKKVTTTKHARERLKSRGVVDNSFVVAAAKKGLDVYAFPNSEFRNYLISRIRRRHKRVKVYKGWVFVWLSTTNRLITCYQIKEKYIEEYNRYMLERNRRRKTGRISNKTNKGGQVYEGRRQDCFSDQINKAN